MWNYSNPAPINIAPQGNFRARIKNAVWDVSKSSGHDMLVITLTVQAKHSVKYRLVFNPSTPETINRSNYYLKQFCDAFNLNPEDMNKQGFSLNQWIGAEGGVFIEHTIFNGMPVAQVRKILSRKQYEFLPPYEQNNQQNSFGQSAADPQNPANIIQF